MLHCIRRGLIIFRNMVCAVLPGNKQIASGIPTISTCGGIRFSTPIYSTPGCTGDQVLGHARRPDARFSYAQFFGLQYLDRLRGALGLYYVQQGGTLTFR